LSSRQELLKGKKYSGEKRFVIRQSTKAKEAGSWGYFRHSGGLLTDLRLKSVIHKLFKFLFPFSIGPSIRADFRMKYHVKWQNPESLL